MDSMLRSSSSTLSVQVPSIRSILKSPNSFAVVVHWSPSSLVAVISGATQRGIELVHLVLLS